MRKEDVLHRVNEERNIQQNNEEKANSVDHILHRNCHQKHVTEGEVQERIEVTGRRGRRHMQLLGDRKEERIL